MVERRRAVGVNILEGMRSIFWWEDKMDRAEEAVLLAKTKQRLISELTETEK